MFRSLVCRLLFGIDYPRAFENIRRYANQLDDLEFVPDGEDYKAIISMVRGGGPVLPSLWTSGGLDAETRHTGTRIELANACDCVNMTYLAA